MYHKTICASHSYGCLPHAKSVSECSSEVGTVCYKLQYVVRFVIRYKHNASIISTFLILELNRLGSCDISTYISHGLVPHVGESCVLGGIVILKD